MEVPSASVRPPLVPHQDRQDQARRRGERVVHQGGAGLGGGERSSSGLFIVALASSLSDVWRTYVDIEV